MRFARGRMGFKPGDAAAAPAHCSEARRLREALEELGPTFVKFGQMLSQRDDLFPAPLVVELRGSFPAAAAGLLGIAWAVVALKSGKL